ncbi:MAG: glycoside hydrolase family 13 protein [Chitinophagales bacterium]
MKKLFFFLPVIFFCCNIISQNIQQMCPPSWWVGMKNPELQIMIYGENISSYDVKTNYPGVTIVATTKVENKNYLFVDLIIETSTKPGQIQFSFSSPGKTYTQLYELKQREKRTIDYGLNSSDFIYLIMPDRFANGDPGNDSIAGMQEKYYGRKSLTSRHGGDLQGIINNLDYLNKLGVTGVWCTPLLENDQPEWSYHGYAMTDHYKIDRRFGTNELYKKYAQESHKRNMKVVMDIVPNHCGSNHWMIKDMPMQNWVHQWDTYTKTNYRTPTLVDNYASEYDKNLMLDGWFDKHMPDLNHDNPFLATYLTQSYIWWIEYAHLDGFRIDTYTYNDLQYMIDMQKKVFSEYPGFGMFAETWVDGIAVQSYFKGDNNLNTGYNSTVPGLTDFELLWSINDMVNEPFGWVDGVGSIYLKLSQDYVYGDANKNVVFIGNHDLSRFYSVCGENIDKMKQAVTFILTTRGIPQWYYGDEILMKNFTNPDGRVREDFPGGWQGDKTNKFDESNLEGKEKDFFNYVRTLANYRKISAPITQGKLMQFVPYDGVYVYFRYTESECVMVVINSSNKEMELSTKNYAERTDEFAKAKNVLTGAVTNLTSIKIPAMSAEVFELQK